MLDDTEESVVKAPGPDASPEERIRYEISVIRGFKKNMTDSEAEDLYQKMITAYNKAEKEGRTNVAFEF